jgi:ABC-2 type transport system permease protein
MKKVLILIIYDLKNIWSDWKTLVFIFFIPLGILACLSYFFASVTLQKQLVEPFNVAIVNNDHTMATRTMIQQFNNSKQIKDLVTMIQANDSLAMSMLKDNRIASVIIIPKGFSADLSHGKNTPVVVVGNNQRPLQSLLVKSLMESSADFVTAAQSGVNTVYRFLEKADAPSEVVQNKLQNSILMFTINSLGRLDFFHEEEITDFAIRSPNQFYFFSGLIILIELWGLMLTSVFRENRNKRVEQRLLLCGVKKRGLVLANLISLSNLLFLQATVVVIAVSLLFNQQNLNAILAVILISYSVGALFIFLSSLVSDPTLFNLTGLSAILLFAFIGGGIVPLSYLPPAFGQLSLLSINKWALDLVMQTVEGPISSLPIVNMTAIAIFCYILAVFAHEKRVRR